MHSSRHTVASRALLAGESVDEIAFLLGHRDANVTRAVYVREVADARRRSMRRSRMVAEFGAPLRVALGPGDEGVLPARACGGLPPATCLTSSAPAGPTARSPGGRRDAH